MTKRREAWLTDASLLCKEKHFVKYFMMAAILIGCGDKAEDSGEPEEAVPEEAEQLQKPQEGMGLQMPYIFYGG